MVKKKVEEVKDEVVEEVKDKKIKSASVYSASGNFVRTYTEEHSDKDKDYKEKAEGYAKKIGGTVK